MNLGLDEIFAVIDKVKTAELDGFEYSDVDMKIKIKNCGGKTPSARNKSMTASQENKIAEQTESFYQNQMQTSASYQEQMQNMGEISQSSLKEEPVSADNLVMVESPMVGTFYVAPSEGADPFIRVGDKVKSGQVIGIIEAMKLMNEIEANVDGIVEEVFVENETMVEFGQPLIKIRKNG